MMMRWNKLRAPLHLFIRNNILKYLCSQKCLYLYKYYRIEVFTREMSHELLQLSYAKYIILI